MIDLVLIELEMEYMALNQLPDQIMMNYYLPAKNHHLELHNNHIRLLRICDRLHFKVQLNELVKDLEGEIWVAAEEGFLSSFITRCNVNPIRNWLLRKVLVTISRIIFY